MTRQPADPAWSGEEPPEGYEPPAPPDDLPTGQVDAVLWAEGVQSAQPDDERRVDRVPDQLDASDVEHRFPSLADKTGQLPEDEWDGMCDLDFEMGPSTKDEDIPALVLFANTDFTDPEAVEQRKREWHDLFDGSV